MERVSPLKYVPNVPTPQLSKPRANRVAASAVFLRAKAVPSFMLMKLSMKVVVFVVSLMVAFSIQNLVTVTGISLLAYPWLVSAITWSMKPGISEVTASNSAVYYKYVE